MKSGSTSSLPESYFCRGPTSLAMTVSLPLSPLPFGDSYLILLLFLYTIIAFPGLELRLIKIQNRHLVFGKLKGWLLSNAEKNLRVATDTSPNGWGRVTLILVPVNSLPFLDKPAWQQSPSQLSYQGEYVPCWTCEEGIVSHLLS